jgi:uncharacterized membrane protein YraQ (UPF0718 family)
MKEINKLILLLFMFLLCYFFPFEHPLVKKSGLEGFLMLREYAREHVLTCLVPAFFIAGAISVFVSQASVLKYFGAKANRLLSFSVASVSGTVLSVCSCTILPLFAGIYTRGAGIGPATAFLYSGPAINVLAIIMTTRVLGFEIGLVRAVGAVFFAIITGLLMAYIFRKEDARREVGDIYLPETEERGRSLLQDVVCMLAMVMILIIATIAKPETGALAIWHTLFTVKWYLFGGLILGLLVMVAKWYTGEERRNWLESTWWYMKQIFPLLFAGVFVAGFLLGRPDHPGLIPEESIQRLVGGNSLGANVFAAMAGALMYFSTLTEIPILQGLLGAGMGKGPALALLLAGPALSLPNMLVIGRVMGVKKTAAFCLIIIILSSLAGMGYGMMG